MQSKQKRTNINNHFSYNYHFSVFEYSAVNQKVAFTAGVKETLVNHLTRVAVKTIRLDSNHSHNMTRHDSGLDYYDSNSS